MSEQEKWQLAGSAPDNYERYQVPSLFGPMAELFLSAVNLKTGERVLDVACGTGIVARLAAPQVGATGHVTGVDLNPGMLKVAAENTPTSGAPIDWREGDAGNLPCEDGYYHTVLCQQGLQFFSDQPQALQEIHRVLVPQGRVAICSWASIDDNPFNQVISAALGRHVSADAATRILAPFSLGDPEVLRTLVSNAHFHHVEIETHVLTRDMLPPEESIPGYLAATPVAQDVLALTEATRAALVMDITEGLSPYQVPDGLSIPQRTNIAIAHK